MIKEYIYSIKSTSSLKGGKTMKENTIITVSREYGSGGKEISEILAKKLGVRCYDRQILYLAAQEIGPCILLRHFRVGNFA